MRGKAGALLVTVALLVGAATAVAHDLDHPVPSFSGAAPPSPAINAGGENAQWELVATIPTGNPHSDLDFFTRGGITYASVGTLAGGANAGGQNIVQLTDETGAVDPDYVTGHPSAACPGVATGVTGLQHDVEAAPKGGALVQFPNPFVDTRDTQLVVDATDAPGRCHDQGTLAIRDTKRGGLEILDVTDMDNEDRESMEIGLTSHPGQAHTVNIDPKRPHIAFVSSSDAVTYGEDGVRTNEGGSPNMDGIEVVDMSSCMNFPAGASRQFKIERCDPDVYRYRWPTAEFASSSVFRATAACHELEVYPDDRIVCAAVNATLLLDFSGAFDDNGTPSDYSDDKPRGTPLPCARRESSTAADPWSTSAFVEDCVVGEGGQDLSVSEWLKMTPRPELEGVEKLGSVHHMGFEDQIRENASSPYESSEDLFVSHEAELTQSGRYILATDERGGGVLPIGASCSPGADNPFGNGGIHAFPVDKLGTTPPEPTNESERSAAVDAYQEQVYAKDSDGERAIFRAPTQTEPQGSLCTSHVFQQIPGQNRIFMGWYSQGTQVVDFTENADGTIDFKRAGFFIPEHANQWTSHVFKVQQNTDGTFTYWGAASDFLLGDAGRNAIDVYKVTLPAPPKPRTASGAPPPGTPTFPVGAPGTEAPTPGTAGQPDPPACASAAAFDTIDARPRRKRKRVRFRFRTRTDEGVTARIFRRSNKRRIVRRKVKTFRDRESGFTWKPRRAPNGFYDVRLVGRAANGNRDRRHVALRRKRGRFYVIESYDRRSSCDLVKYYTLGRPVFGGRKRSPLRIRFKLAQAADVVLRVERRNGKVVRQRRARDYARGKHSVRIRLGKARRGVYRVVLEAEAPGRSSDVTLFARHL